MDSRRSTWRQNLHQSVYWSSSRLYSQDIRDHSINKCIGDDTKAAARQSLNCIKNKKIKYGEKRFSICRMEYSYTLQCGMWLWNRDSEFTKWQHPAMWHVAVGWHASEFAQTSAILEFYIWFPFPHITAVDMSFCTSLRNFIQIGPPSAERKWLHFQDVGSPPSWILGVRDGFFE